MGFGDRAQRECDERELVQPRELTCGRRIELVAARQRRLVRLGVERQVYEEIFGRDRRTHTEAEPNGDTRALHPGVLRCQRDGALRERLGPGRTRETDGRCGKRQSDEDDEGEDGSSGEPPKRHQRRPGIAEP